MWSFLTPPPLPDWNSLHPIIVHLPIGAFVAAPLLLALALFFGYRHRGLAWATLTVMAFGVIGAFLATMTGEAAADIAVTQGDAGAILHEHEELAEMVRNVLAAITGAYFLLLLIATGLKDRLKPVGWAAIHLLVYLALFPALIGLANAGHLGGRLVHQYGITAKISGPPPDAAADDHEDADDGP